MNRGRTIGFMIPAMAAAGCAHLLPGDRLAAYPQARQADVVDTYHGVQVADPYRWLEDPDSPETRTWIESENEICFGYLERIAGRRKILDRLTELWDHERYGVPSRHGDRYIFTKNDGLQNQSVLYTVRALDEQPEMLIDPNTFSDDGTVALSGQAVSLDGKYIAYAVASGGSDWRDWHVRDIESGEDLPDCIKWSKFYGASWTADGMGFFYSRFDEPAADAELRDVNYFNKLCYHRLGAPQSEDVLVYERPDQKEWGFNGEVTDDGRYLIITVSQGTERKNRLFYKDLSSDGSAVVELIDELEARYLFIDNDGPVFWLQTDLDAPRGRIIGIDTRTPEKEHWMQIVAEAADTLHSVDAINDTFVVTYLKDAHSLVRMFGLDGTFLRALDLPGIGTVSGIGGTRGDGEFFYAFTGFSTPSTIYRYDFGAGRSEIFRRPSVDFDPDAYVTSQVFYTSKDGTRVPMFVTHKKGIRLDGKNPTYLYGYGGFNIAMTPYFSVSNAVWMEMGGVYAVPNIRGGGEYGRQWHQAGCKLNRQNVFDDFIAAAEWLIANNYTCPDKLAIGGGSNGGLLVAACMIQRPELFGAVLPAVGVLDMLRFHKFTIGWAWVSDYGSPEDPEEFAALHAYSPLHNLERGTSYPAVLITTADHDDRVVPAHSFKFAAALQAAQGGDAPVLIRIETRAGHGAGKPTTKRIEEEADKWAFLTRTLGMKL